MPTAGTKRSRDQVGDETKTEESKADRPPISLNVVKQESSNQMKRNNSFASQAPSEASALAPPTLDQKPSVNNSRSGSLKVIDNIKKITMITDKIRLLKEQFKVRH